MDESSDALDEQDVDMVNSDELSAPQNANLLYKSDVKGRSQV